jgi:hypothetical protein
MWKTFGVVVGLFLSHKAVRKLEEYLIRKNT